MIYYIDIDVLLINIRKYYRDLIAVIDEDVLIDFINNCVDPKDSRFVNISYVNYFRHAYPNEFKHIMNIAKVKYI